VPGPENTAAAVRAAIAAGADGCEVDVRRTADGRLVCTHDPAVNGLTVIEATLDELAATGVATLGDLIAAAGRSRLVVEVKNVPGEPDFTPDAVTAELLVGALSELTPAHDGPRLLVSSFDPASLDVARDAGWPTGLLTLPGVDVADGLAFARDAGYGELHAHISMITSPPAQVHAAGMRLIGWTVTTIGEALAAQELGVDGLICDDPAVIVGALAGLDDALNDDA
jgi:glycerophosphoryl diester phosphodiesterase